MNQGTKFAIALVMFMIASVGLFIAFHPNQARSAKDLFDSLEKDLEKGSPARGNKQ